MVSYTGILRLLLLVLLFYPGQSHVYSQISSSGYAKVEVAGYDTDHPDSADSIYIFCNISANLSASFSDLSGELKFEWSEYDPLLPGYKPPFRTDHGTGSDVTGLSSGGYKVRISRSGDVDTVFRAWVFVNRPVVIIDEDLINHTCQVLDLPGRVEVDTFFYYDPKTNMPDTLSPVYVFDWHAHPHVPVASGRLNPRIWNPPATETEFTLKVSYHSCQVSYTVIAEPITTKALFDIDQVEGEAPLEVSFDSGESLNAQRFEWYFEYYPGRVDEGPPDYVGSDPGYTYYIPGRYYVMLRTVSEYYCQDTLIYPQTVNVLPSEVEVPNVFSPGSEGSLFKVRAVSIRKDKFSARVLNRYGRKVFEWSDPSEGWDGTFDGNPVSPGVYYDVISARGWDDVEYELSGPLYLFRGRSAP